MPQYVHGVQSTKVLAGYTIYKHYSAKDMQDTLIHFVSDKIKETNVTEFTQSKTEENPNHLKQYMNLTE